MKYLLDLYNQFKCLGGDCPSTCCAGWAILVDEKSRQRFSKLEDVQLRHDILSHLETYNGRTYFKQTNGQCWMLEQDGLCRIQKKFGEQVLSNTCRKFPRLTAKVECDIWMSMAASCPVVARHLWRQKIRWMIVKEDGTAILTENGSLFPVDWKKGQQPKRKKWDLARYELALDMTEAVVELMVQYREIPYLEGSFDYYEQDELTTETLQKDTQSYEEHFGRKMDQFWGNYADYRYFSRFLEFQEESEENRGCQILGELCLIDIICFSRFSLGKYSGADQVPEVIQWVYRFCAHGKLLGAAVNNLFCKMFSDYP